MSIRSLWNAVHFIQIYQVFMYLKKPQPFLNSQHLIFASISMQVSKHFQIIKDGESPILEIFRLIFFP